MALTSKGNCVRTAEILIFSRGASRRPKNNKTTWNRVGSTFEDLTVKTWISPSFHFFFQKYFFWNQFSPRKKYIFRWFFFKVHLLYFSFPTHPVTAPNSPNHRFCAHMRVGNPDFRGFWDLSTFLQSGLHKLCDLQLDRRDFAPLFHKRGEPDRGTFVHFAHPTYAIGIEGPGVAHKLTVVF